MCGLAARMPSPHVEAGLHVSFTAGCCAAGNGSGGGTAAEMPAEVWEEVLSALNPLSLATCAQVPPRPLPFLKLLAIAERICPEQRSHCSLGSDLLDHCFTLTHVKVYRPPRPPSTAENEIAAAATVASVCGAHHHGWSHVWMRD